MKKIMDWNLAFCVRFVVEKIVSILKVWLSILHIWSIRDKLKVVY